MELETKVVDKIPVLGKHGAIQRAILEAEIGQWVEVKGFVSVKEMGNAYCNLNSGKRSFGNQLKLLGLRLQTKRDIQNLVLYVRKIERGE
jgi:hypothetical protein